MSVWNSKYNVLVTWYLLVGKVSMIWIIREMLHHNWLDGIVELVLWEIERCSFTIGMLYFRQPELNGNEHNTLFMS